MYHHEEYSYFFVGGWYSGPGDGEYQCIPGAVVQHAGVFEGQVRELGFIYCVIITFVRKSLSDLSDCKIC
jgi:hypothetical protein